MSLAQIYLDQGDLNLSLQALEHVPVSELGLNVHIFQWNALLAEISAAMGEAEVSKGAARRALGLLTAPDQFSRHPGVGKAIADTSLVRRLERLERDGSPQQRPRLFKLRS